MLRAYVDRSEAALDWLRRVDEHAVHALWPDLVVAEVANATARLVRAGHLTAAAARGIVAQTLEAPVASIPVAPLVAIALELALDRSLTVYDACYAALAEAVDARLVTADRRLAAATANAVLVAA